MIMNKCRYLHSIINDNITCLNWCKAQLNFETKLKDYTRTNNPIRHLLIIRLLSMHTYIINYILLTHYLTLTLYDDTNNDILSSDFDKESCLPL